MDVIIGLGSNLGERELHLATALQHLQSIGPIIKTTTPVETQAIVSPIGIAPNESAAMPPFLNQAVRLRTSQKLMEVFYTCKAIEKQMGRVPSIAWKSRTIDLDMLWCSTGWYVSPVLSVPHPQIVARPFLIDQLKELLSDEEGLWLKCMID